MTEEHNSIDELVDDLLEAIALSLNVRRRLKTVENVRPIQSA